MKPFCIHRLSWHSAIITLVTLLVLYPAWSLAAPPFPEFIDPNPKPGNQFGATVVALSTGNVVITSRYDDASDLNAGAVYLFNGATGALISTLRGSLYNSYVGSGGVTALPNGNFLIHSPYWRDGVYVGAVTFGNGVTGVSGVVSSSNSLVGRTGDGVGFNDSTNPVTILSNGNYVVCSPSWHNGSAWSAGAVTWGSGTTGVSGEISSSNSLIGTTANDQVGKALAGTPTSLLKSCVTALSNGNYVVNSRYWDHAGAADAGAVTWGSGTSGVKGAVSSSNSLVGSSAGDQVGNLSTYDNGGCVMTLGNGNYVVVSPLWDNAEAVNAGAVTWGSGTSGASGVISSSNSLVGTTAEDSVGRILTTKDVVTTVLSNGVTVLGNGNYVVASPSWDHGPLVDAGAVTWGDGTLGFSGIITSVNSLVGLKQGDKLGYGGVAALTNGHYVTSSPLWDNGTVVDAGAVTWGNGTTGFTGSPTESNSLVGTQAYDGAGSGGAAALTNGNYVALSPNWNFAKRFVGAATWCDGTTGRSGIIAMANSLVGTKESDQIGKSGVMALRNGNYLVRSPYYENAGKYYAGAVTWGSGTSGVKGVVSSSNSLVGGHDSDWVGSAPIIELTNGNYVVASPNWHSGDKAWAGAATWCNGTTGLSGVVSSSNSLVGTNLSDQVGRGVTALSNGNYVVSSPYWNNGQAQDAGAATWGNGTTGVKGIVSSGNSLVGTTAEDSVGSVMELGNGNYVVTSGHWHNGSASYAGAVTWGSGSSGVKGPVSSSNSLVGTSEFSYLGHNVTKMSNGNYVVQSYVQESPGTSSSVWAVTWGRGTSGVSGAVSGSNSLLGLTSSDSEVAKVVKDEVNRTYFGLFPREAKVRVGSQVDGLDPSTPDIAVAQANPLTDGVGSINFGTTTIGDSTPLTLTITNPGTAELAGLAVSKEGTNADDFSLSALSDTSIPGGNGSVSLTVTFSPSSIGVRTAVIRIASNVAGTKNPFDITVTGTGVYTDCNLSSLSVNGVTLTPTFATDTVSYTGSVSNTVTTLTVSPVTSQALASVWVRVNGGGYTLPSSPLTLIVGTNTVEVLVTAQDGTSTKTYTLIVTRAAAPEIAISGNNVEIGNGDSTPSVPDGTHFGSVAIASGMNTHIFTLANMGTFALNLTGAPVVTITGPHATDFHVSLVPNSPVATSSSTTFQVTFDPTAFGVRTAVVSIDSDDADESPYTFAISGFGRFTSQAAHTLVFTAPLKLYMDESPFTLSASTSSGLPVDYTVVSGSATVSGNVLTLTGTGVVKVRASQPGNADFLAAAPVERTLTVAASPPTLTLANLSQTYTGSPCPISVLGATGPVDVTYKVGLSYVPTAPTNAGSYAVKAVEGGVPKTGTLIITKAPLFVTPDDQRKFAGQANPALGFGYSGFLGSDLAANSVSKAPVIVTTATTTSAGGFYPITASGGSSPNYLFVYLKGAMKVETFAALYEALLVDAGTLRPSGKLELTVAASSKTFTGKLTTPTETAAVGLNGSLTTNTLTETAIGTATVKKGANTYLVTVTLPLTGDFTTDAKFNGASLGTATNGRKLLTLATGQKLGYIGTHSALLAPATNGVDVPAGAGWAVATIDAKGLLKLTGKLADGTSLTASLAADVSSNPGYRLFSQPYTPARTGSFIAGDFALMPHPDLASRRIVAFEDAADLTWVKAPRLLDSSYRAGFGPVAARFTLDPWLPPVPAKGMVPAITLAQRLGLTANQFTAQYSTIISTSFADLPTTMALNTTTNVVSVIAPVTTPLNTTKWKVAVTPTTGAYAGSFELTDGGKKRLVPFTGLMRQPPSTDTSGLIGDGNFLLPSLSPTPNNEVLSGELGFER